MKRTFWTRNLCMGVLMGFVMVLGVQGICEALTITPTSNLSQSKRLGSTFEITFSVGLRSPAIAYNSARKRVSDDNTQTLSASVGRIDSSGYRVYDATNGREYRFSSAATGLTADLFVDPRPAYEYVSGNTGDRSPGAPASGGTADRGGSVTDLTGTSDLYVDTSRRVVDATGKLVYTRTGAGTRADTGAGTANEPYKYTLVERQHPDGPIDEEDRFDYNEEKITITVAGGTLSFTDKRDGFPASEMSERSHFAQLRSSVTLVCVPESEGTYTITIADTTIDDDFPVDRVPPTKDSEVFTLHVTPKTFELTSGDNITADRERVRTTDDVLFVSDLLNFPLTGGEGSAPKNYRILYEVVKGSGKLYVGTLEQSHTTPAQTLTVHQTSDVFLNMNGTSNEVHVWFANEDRSAPRATIIFEYKGKPLPTTRAPTPTPTPTPTPVPTTRTLTFSPTSISGAAGTTQSLTVSAGTGSARLVDAAAFISAGGSVSRGSGNNWSITLPDSSGSNYRITFGASGYDDRTITVSVSAPAAPGRLSLTTVEARSGTQQQIRITASGRTIPSAGLVVSLHGVVLPQTVTIPSGSTSVSRIVTLSSTTSAHTVYATATNYNNSPSITIPAPSTGSQQQQQQQQQEEEETLPEPASLEISGPATRRGTANTALEAPLLVRVLDADDGGVEDARVFFRVRKGQGRLSQRGNGRAIGVYTDSRGYARADYTPISASSTVEAEVTGVRTSVTFTITATGAAPSTDTPGDPTPGTTGDTTPSTIRPTVLVAAAQRPPMLWVDGGKIYALVGTNVQEFVPNLNNVMNITIGGGKVYWTAKTSASSGTINVANLDGSGMKEVTSIMAIPMGIAVDTPNSLLYWTNSRGRIQSANLDGSGIRNVMQNLRNPNDLALAGGNVYWTESNHGSVRFVNLRGQKQVRVISTGDDPAGSLVIGGGKVYWTEKVGDSGGTINAANLNGSGAKEIASILATPIGIAVDGARSKLYWTNARGRIQSAPLDGSSIRNVVSGLGMPGDMVLSNSIKAPTATTPTTKSTTTAANKYDVNGDGTVDSKDSDALIVAVAAGITDAKYDVNGDGKVDISDVVAVTANRSAAAASAPTLLGTKLSALEIGTLQEQIDLLIATGDRSPAAMQTLIYLQQLIAMARPEKTQLLANYPNPFNPETWIPYELATDTDVRLTIYSSTGVVVRMLQLGHQTAGYYTDRERAAYWDGRNAFGEPVASGVYYYQLETDTQSLLRKMVILK